MTYLLEALQARAGEFVTLRRDTRQASAILVVPYK